MFQKFWSILFGGWIFMYLKPLYINVMKRIIAVLCVLRPHKDGSGKNNFQ